MVKLRKGAAGLAATCLIFGVSGCSSAPPSPGGSSTGASRSTLENASTCPSTGPPNSSRCLVEDHGRFAISLSAGVASGLRRVGLLPERVLAGDVDRVGGLLPDLPSSIVLQTGARRLDRVAFDGVTDGGGAIRLSLDLAPGAESSRRTIAVWLLQDLSHEIDHSVRIESNVPCEGTVGALYVCEGMASAFDLQVQPGIRLPWLHSLSPAQVAQTWRRVRPRLADLSGVDDVWFFGGAKGIPRLAGFQVGYDIIAAYLHRHRKATAASLVAIPTAELLRGSGFHP